MSEKHLTSFPSTGSLDDALSWYARQPWLRAAVQIIPIVGGSADTLLAWRGTALAERRFQELAEDVSRRVADLEMDETRGEFLASEEFIEILQTTIEAAARSASLNKRRRAAAFLARTIADARVTDLSQQVADDLEALRDLHLRILAALPDRSHTAVIRGAGAASKVGLEDAVFEKGLSDLARMGFIRLNTDDIGTLNGGAGHWETTDYLVAFKDAIRD